MYMLTFWILLQVLKCVLFIPRFYSRASHCVQKTLVVHWSAQQIVWGVP
jgi:hypothetical protein